MNQSNDDYPNACYQRQDIKNDSVFSNALLKLIEISKNKRQTN